MNFIWVFIMSSEDAKETVILSANNPLLQRALNHQASGDDEIEETNELSHEILFLIRGMVERFELKQGQIIKIGRYDISENAQELDLTPYGAGDRGVSRDHAQVHVEDAGIFITDLNSTNGTYIHGKRLDPQTPTLLQKGTELLLGRLTLQVMFH